MALTSVRRRLALVLFALLPALPLAAADQQAKPLRVEAEMLDGSPYSLASREGGITLLSVWSPESLSSRKCIWELQRFASAYESRGVYTLAASTLNDKNALRGFIAKRKLSLPVAILGKHDLGRMDELRLPLVYVFDSKGQLLATHAGLFSMAVLERLVAPLLPPLETGSSKATL
jgi:hypothetical protein